MFCAEWELPQALLFMVAEAVGMCYAKGAERRVCMGNCFNIIADCKPQRHFMVNRGWQYVIEMKIYHGDSYNRRGEEQLADYLETYHLEKGYLLNFNFNKNKEPGIKTVICKGTSLLETMV